mgnify:CR=1 FL=1
MKRKSIVAGILSLVLAVGSAPIMSLAEEVVTDGQTFDSEENQNQVVNTFSDEKRIYNPEYDFDSNLITLQEKSEEDQWKIAVGDVTPQRVDTFSDVAQGMAQDAIEYDSGFAEDKDITVSEDGTSSNKEIVNVYSGKTIPDDEVSAEISVRDNDEVDSDEVLEDFSDGQENSIEDIPSEEAKYAETEIDIQEAENFTEKAQDNAGQMSVEGITSAEIEPDIQDVEDFTEEEKESEDQIPVEEIVPDEAETDIQDVEDFTEKEEKGENQISVEEIVSDEAQTDIQEEESTPQYLLENGVLIVSGTGKIDDNLYKSNKDITELVIKSGITSIGAYSFYECTSLKKVTLPSTLTEIGDYAFAKCTTLSEIELNEGLSTIGERTFEDCTALKKAFIPVSVENGQITYTYNEYSNKAWGIFNNCSELTVVEFAEGTTRIHAGLFGGSGLSMITLPETVTEIGRYAFANCNLLEEINFPDGLKKIEERAFSNCTSVKKIDFSENVNDIGPHSFDSDIALTEVTIPLNLQDADIYYEYNSYDHNAWGIFNGCVNLKTVNFAEGTSYIHGGMFAGSGLTKISLPDTVVRVGDYAFSNCSSLNSFATGGGLQDIGANAFANCTSLKDLEFLDSLEGIGEGAFYGCTGFTELTLPETLSEIGIEAFGNCTSLKKVILPVTVMDGSSYHYSYNTVGSCKAEGIFNGCSNLEEVIFPENSTRIPGGLLAGSGIKNITIPDTITSIGPYAFSNTEITRVIIPDTVTDIGFCAFSACSKLEELTVSAGWNNCSEFEEESGFYSQGNIVIKCSALETVFLPEGMKKIPDYAFSNCSNIKYMDFPNSLTEIGKYAFANCDALTSIHISEGVAKIGDHAFEDCNKLLVMNVPDTVTVIGQSVFDYCPSLSQINYTGSSKAWSNISISTSSNEVLDKIVINYNFKVTYTEGDFIGVWDGEYDGESGGNVVRRHFVFEINTCEKISKNIAQISGVRTISQSLENPSVYYAEGSDNMSGTVNLQTGAVSFKGYSWIQYPTGPDATGNWDHMEYDGYIEPDKKSIKGINSGDYFRTFHAENLAIPSGTSTSVVLKYNNGQYDLYKDEVSIAKDSTEKVSIIVSPDWKGTTAGKVRIYQKDFAIENKTGIFLDIAPGKLFKQNESIYMELVDSNDKVVDTRRLTLRVETPGSSREKLSISNTSLKIYENKNKSTAANDSYVVSNNVEVVSKGRTYKTDKTGKVKFPTISSGNVTISKKGYISRTFTAAQLAENNRINLQLVNDNGPVISGVWIGDIDVLNQSYALNMTSTQELTLNLEIDWGKSYCDTVKLMQDQRTVEFDEDSLTTVVSDNFDISKDIFIVAKDEKGHITKRKLQFQNGPVDSVLKSLNGVSFSVSDKISISLPDNFKPEFLAGENFGVGINDVSSRVPITLSAENGKVYVAIGVDLLNYGYSDKMAQSTASGNTAHVLEHETFNFIKDFKDTGVMNAGGVIKNIKKLKNLKQTYNTAIKYPQGKFGVDADFTILGFAEGTYDDKGNISWIDSGVILNPSGSISKSWPFVVMAGPVPIPMYWEGNLSVDALAKLNLIFDKQVRNFLPDGELSGTLNLSGGLGAGIKSVLYASGGMEGKLKPDWNIVKGDTDSFILTATLNAYAKAGIACFEGKYSFDPIYNEVWVKYPEEKDLLTQSATTGTDILLDTGQYKLKDLSYLEKGSDFIANDKEASKAAMFSSKETSDTTEIFKFNIYRESTPVIANLSSGRKIAVWTDAVSSDVNAIMLYYSVYENGTWSVPATVYNDGTMDYAPCLKVINGTAYLAWQNATKKFEDIASLGLSGIAGDFDISVGTFHEKEGRFSVSTIPYSNLDMMPVLTGNDSGVYIVWVNNSENDWLGANDSNRILYAQLNESSWNSATVAYDGLYSISGIAADYDGSLNIAYSMDTDKNISTSDDLRVYENGVQISGNISSYSPEYNEHQLYWRTQNNIVNKQTMENEGTFSSDDFQILNVNGEKAVLYTVVNGLTSTLMISYYNKETASWGNGTALTDGRKFIGAFNAETDAFGNIFIMANCAEVTGTMGDENPYGDSNMVVITVNFAHDLSLDNVYYAEDAFCAGTNMPFTLEVSNKGNTLEKGMKIEIKDEKGELLASQEIDDILVPGEAVKTTISYAVDKAVKKQDIKILVAPKTEEDADMGNNVQEIHLTYEKVFIENLDFGYNDEGKAVISADIVNRGYNTRNGLTVYLTKKTIGGKVIASKKLNKVAPLDLQTVSFEISAKQNEVYYMILKENGKDTNLADDFLTIYEPQTYKKEHKHTYTITVIKATMKKNGSVVKKCTGCGKIVSKNVIFYPKTVVLSKTNYVYNGKIQKPSVVIKDESGKKIASSNYKVTCTSGCKNVGSYTVKVTFRGNYTGTVSKKFIINPKGCDISNLYVRLGAFTVRWKKQSVQTTGYQIQYAANSSFRNAKIVTIPSAKTISRTISRLGKKKKYFVRIRTYKIVGKTKYYSAWSKEKSVKTK